MVSEHWIDVQKKREESTLHSTNDVIFEHLKRVSSDVVRAVSAVIHVIFDILH